MADSPGFSEAAEVQDSSIYLAILCLLRSSAPKLWNPGIIVRDLIMALKPTTPKVPL